MLATMFSSSMGPGGGTTASRPAPHRSPPLGPRPAASPPSLPPPPRPAHPRPARQCLPTLLPRRAPIGPAPQEASPPPPRRCSPVGPAAGGDVGGRGGEREALVIRRLLAKPSREEGAGADWRERCHSGSAGAAPGTDWVSVNGAHHRGRPASCGI